MKARLDLLQGDSADVGGEVAAQAVQDLLGGQLGLGAEGDDLALGVGPASVRPEAATSMGWSSRRESSVSSFPWMVWSVFPCFCQPFQRVPS